MSPMISSFLSFLSFSSSVYDVALEPARPMAFDMYVLAQSWQPAFCFHKAAQFPGCRAPQAYWRSHLTLHGLWPERAGSLPPSFCSDEAFDADKIEQKLGLATLHQYWPDVKFQDVSPLYADFWKHEWLRHGTCSGLDQVSYFTHAIDLERNDTLAPTPDLVQDNVGQDVNATTLRRAFGDAALKCQSGHGNQDVVMFSQVFTCWQKDEHMSRPDACSVQPIFTPKTRVAKVASRSPLSTATNDPIGSQRRRKRTSCR